MKQKKRKKGMSYKSKWIITGALCVLALLTVVIAAADGCFDFKSGSVQANDNAVESTAPEDESIAAMNGEGTHTVLVTAGYGGATDPNGSVEIEDWGSLTVAFTPNEGYEVQAVTVDGEDMGALESYTLSNITQDHSVVATFVKSTAATPSADADE